MSKIWSRFCVKDTERGPKIWGGVRYPIKIPILYETMIFWYNPGQGIHSYLYKSPYYFITGDIAKKCNNHGYRKVTIDQLTDIYPEFVDKVKQFILLTTLRI